MANKLNVVSVLIEQPPGTPVTSSGTQPAYAIIPNDPFQLTVSVQNLRQKHESIASVSIVYEPLTAYSISPPEISVQLPLRPDETGSVSWVLSPEASLPSSITVNVVDADDNKAENSPQIISLTNAATITSTTTVGVSGQAGQPDHMITATIGPTGPAMPTGSVEFGFRPLSNRLAAPPAPTVVPLPSDSVAKLVFPSLPAGLYKILARYSGDDFFTYSFGESDPITVPGVYVIGSLLTSAGGNPIPGVLVRAQDLTTPSNTPNPVITNSLGGYSIEVAAGDTIQVLFPPSHHFNSQTLILKSSPRVYLGQVNAVVTLPDTYYEISACQLMGTLLQMGSTGNQPLSGVSISLVDPARTASPEQATTDAQGNFCFNPPVPKGGACFILEVPANVTVGKNTFVLSSQGGSTAQTTIPLTPDTPTVPSPFIYTAIVGDHQPSHRW